MKLAEAARVAWEALRANKLRSGLTMLGVVIGVMSVVLLVAIGTGARNEVTAAVGSLGSNILFVAPGSLELGTAPSVSRLRLVTTRSKTWSMKSAGTSMSRLISRLKNAADRKNGRNLLANSCIGG